MEGAVLDNSDSPKSCKDKSVIFNAAIPNPAPEQHESLKLQGA